MYALPVQTLNSIETIKGNEAKSKNQVKLCRLFGYQKIRNFGDKATWQRELLCNKLEQNWCKSAEKPALQYLHILVQLEKCTAIH